MIDDINGKISKQHSNDDEEEASLDQEVILILNGCQEQVTDSGIRKHHLCDQRTRNDHAQLQRQPGELGQDGIVEGILADQTLRARPALRGSGNNLPPVRR